MKYKIGIFGSATGNIEANKGKADDLGRALAKHNCILINGACDGLPYQSALTASQLGVEVWGYSPAVDLKSHQKISPHQDVSIYKKIIYMPNDFSFIDDLSVCRKYRNVISTANCDAGIIISGRWGTMSEFTNLYDMGKVIGILTDTGGVADEIKNLSNKISKATGATLIFNTHSNMLVEQVVNLLSKL